MTLYVQLETKKLNAIKNFPFPRSSVSESAKIAKTYENIKITLPYNE